MECGIGHGPVSGTNEQAMWVLGYYIGDLASFLAEKFWTVETVFGVEPVKS